MRLVTRGTALWGIVALVLVVWACETTRNPGGIQRDLIPPVLTLSNTAGDTQQIAGGLRFTVSAADNLSLKSIDLTFSGGLISTIDTTFISETKTYTKSYTITFGSNSGAGGSIKIVGRATDGAGNNASDSILIFLSNVQALRVRLNLPSPGALGSTGKGIPVDVVAVQNSGVAKVGFLVSPAASVTNPTTPPNDSLVFSAPFADSVEYVDTLIVVPSTGTFNVQGFAEDSAGRRGFSNVVTVTIQSVATDNTPPVVGQRIASRVEVDDTVHVRAQDPSAISWIGFKVDTGGVTMKFDTVNVAAGNLTDVTRHFTLGLGGLQPLPHTIVVVGLTRGLPFGGSIADAIFNGNDSSLYLTNPSLGRVEIFQVANTSFVAAGIPTAGPQPWGIALWPHDTLGNYGDTIVVANAGGVELSVIDVSPGVRRLAWRQDLPDYLIETYRVLTNPLRAEIIVYDVSDRPQYLATVCRTAGSPACAPDSIFAIYSTTPTQSSSSPFNGKATLRMEKLINTLDTTQLFGHFFWEIGATPVGSGTDTLRIELRRGLPYNQTKVILSACAGVNVLLNTFGL